MSNFIKVVLDALKEFLNGLSNTIWGLLIIFICMRMIAHGSNIEAAYYFAGVGSTMIGIKASQNGSSSLGSISNSVINSEVK